MVRAHSHCAGGLRLGRATPQLRIALAVFSTANHKRRPLLFGKNSGQPATLSNLTESSVEATLEPCLGVIERNVRTHIHNC